MLETALTAIATAVTTLIIPKAIEAVGKKVGDTTFDKTANIIQIIKEKFTATGTANLLQNVEEKPTDRNIQELQKELIRQMENDQQFAETLASILEQYNQLSNRKVSPNYWNLPQPDYGKFIGRELEKQKIFTKLRPYPHSPNSVITIDGIGGIGKSALALEVSLYFFREYHNLPIEERFDAIIWTSAKRNTLRADRGIVDKRQALKTLDDICQTIALTLQIEPSILNQTEDKLQLVLRALTQQRTLLIIDNFETIDDESVNEFIQDLLPAPTKAIVTTRHRINVAYPIPLRGMPWEDGKLLIEYECDKKEVSLTDEQIRKLYDRTGGVPLAIVWTIAKLRFGSNINIVLARLGDSKGDIARFCFEEVIDGIKGKDSYKLLLALALNKWSMSREQLGSVAGFTKDELSRDDGLEELQILSLVNKDKDQFSLLPLTKEYIEQQFEFNSEFIGESVCRLIKYNVDKYYEQCGISTGSNFLIKYKHYLSESQIQESVNILSNGIWWFFEAMYYQTYQDEWGWANSWCDFLNTLEKIGGEIAVNELNSWMKTIVSHGYVKNVSFSYGFTDWEVKGCINTLGNLKKYDAVINLFNQYPNDNFIKEKCLEVIENSANKELIPSLQELLNNETNEEIKDQIHQIIEKLTK